MRFLRKTPRVQSKKQRRVRIKYAHLREKLRVRVNRRNRPPVIQDLKRRGFSRPLIITPHYSDNSSVRNIIKNIKEYLRVHAFNESSKIDSFFRNVHFRLKKIEEAYEAEFKVQKTPIQKVVVGLGWMVSGVAREFSELVLVFSRGISHMVAPHDYAIAPRRYGRITSAMCVGIFGSILRESSNVDTIAELYLGSVVAMGVVGLILNPGRIRTQHNRLLDDMNESGVIDSKFEGLYPQDWVKPNIIKTSHPVMFVSPTGDLVFIKEETSGLAWRYRLELLKLRIQETFIGKLGIHYWMFRTKLRDLTAPDKLTDQIATGAKELAKDNGQQRVLGF